MGKVRVRPSGYLYFDFYYQGVRCKEYTELTNTPDNLTLMNEAMTRIDSEIRLGTFEYARYFPDSKFARRFTVEVTKKQGTGFEEYATAWHRNNRISWKPSVQRDFQSVMKRHLMPYFKDTPVLEITKWMVKEFRTELGNVQGKKGRKIGNKRINNIILVLRLIMNEAAEQYDFTTPFTNFKPLPLKKTDIMPFSPDEVFLFLKHAPPEYRDYYVVRFFTGMRTAEIDGLKWKCVDLAGKRIQVRETWQSGQWVSPKTQSSVRDIDMSGIVEDALQRQREKTGKGDLVFPARRGKPLDPNNIAKRVWYPTLRKAELADRTPYQTRHTAATMWLASGENPEWVARQLGHANTEMLFKVYSRYIPNLTRRDGSAFERFLVGKLAEQERTDAEGSMNENGGISEQQA